jgi:hypothetical protein
VEQGLVCEANSQPANREIPFHSWNSALPLAGILEGSKILILSTSGKGPQFPENVSSISFFSNKGTLFEKLT